MKTFGSHNLLLFVLFLAVGGMMGGILGEALSGIHLGNLMPIISQHYEIFNIQNVDLNLYIMQIKFGIRFAPNILSILGIILAFIIFRRIG